MADWFLIPIRSRNEISPDENALHTEIISEQFLTNTLNFKSSLSHYIIIILLKLAMLSGHKSYSYSRQIPNLYEKVNETNGSHGDRWKQALQAPVKHTTFQYESHESQEKW